MENNHPSEWSWTSARDDREISPTTAVDSWPEVTREPLQPIVNVVRSRRDRRMAINSIITSNTQHTHHTSRGSRPSPPNNPLEHRHTDPLDEIASLRTQISNLHQTIAYQQGEMSVMAETICFHATQLERQSDALKARRRRHEVLDTFATRHVLEEGEWELVGPPPGRTTHYGDAVGDAMLYIKGKRRDMSTWSRLYTLMPEKVMELYRQDDEASISVLDMRATNLLTWPDDNLDGREEGRVALERAYRRFIYWLEQGIGEQPHENPDSHLTRMYLEFWDICDTFGFY